jgi:inhibitor of cysteine peptidase
MLHCIHMKRFFLLVIFSLILTPFAGVKATASINAGDLIKASGQAVYYFNDEGKRLVFPNEKTYFTWYSDFSTVKTITDSELASISLGGNVSYRPGTHLIKITTDPKVYAVDANGALRWVTTEAIAKELYGSDWAKNVHDIPDAFFVDYGEGSSITSASDFDPAAIMNSKKTIDADATQTVTTIDRGIVKTSDVMVGDLFRITIDSNPSTGYAWTPTFDSQMLEFVTSTYVAPTSDAIGAAGTERFDFRALKMTSFTDIIFSYARSWETNVAPVERRTFRIIINPVPVSESQITLELGKSQAQTGETITVAASTTISAVSEFRLYANDSLLASCDSDTTCTTNFVIPSTGTASSYDIDAVVTDQNGSTATTTKTITIVNSQTLDTILFTISKTTIRENQTVEINVDPDGILNARSITIYSDTLEIKKCQDSPSYCKYSGTISGSVGSSHIIYAKIISIGGQTYLTNKKTIKIASNDTPSITVTAGKNSLYKTETVQISVSASDNDGIDAMSIKQGNTVIKSC